MSGDTQPTEPLSDPRAQWVLDTPTPAPARRRRWPWIVAIAVVVLIVAAVVGEWIARSAVERTVRQQAIENLDLPADQQIDVEVPGLVLPQLLFGTLTHIDIRSDDVPLHGLVADVHVTADDVPVGRDADWSSAHATISLDQTQLQNLLATLEGFPAATVTLDAPDVAATFDIDVLFTTVQVGVGLTPRAENGDLVLTPSTLSIGGAQLSADALRTQFGALATTVLRDWDVCVASSLPRALTLTEITVQREAIVAGFEIDSAILLDADARENGTCS